MKLSKSKYCNAIQCKKMLWLLNNKPEEKGEESDDLLLTCRRSQERELPSPSQLFLQAPYQRGADCRRDADA